MSTYNSVSHRPFQARSSRLSERAAEVTLYERLNSVLGNRKVVLIGDWVDDAHGFEREPIYLVRGDVIDAFNGYDRSWADLVDQHFDVVDVVPGTVLAATATVRA